MAADSRACRVNEMSWRIVRVPVASLTCRVRRSTTMMGSDMHSLFGARHTRRRLLHFSVGAWAALAAAFSATPALAAPAAAPATREVVVVGDSISAEFGLARGTGWVALLGQRLLQEKLPWSAVNASISGDTTSGGLARLPAVLKSHPAVVVIELGGNDALRGLPMTATRKNLDAMAALATAAGARLVIAAIMVPPNYGRQYTADFAKMYADVAAAHHAALVPFIFKGIADRPDADDWFQADRIHPLAKAHPIILDNIWPALKPLLKS